MCASGPNLSEFFVTRDVNQPTRRASNGLVGSLLAGYHLLATAAFQLAPVAEVALFLSTPPLFVLVLRRMRGDGPGILEILGACLAVAGIALILAPRLTRAENFVNARLIGDALAICAALLTAFYAYAYRELGKKGIALESSSITFMTFPLGSVVLMAVACLVPATISWEALSGTNLPLFLGLAVLCTAISSYAFAFASKRLPPVVTATISLLIPLFASAFAYLILGEKVPSTAIPGSALVIVGIVMILRGNSRITPGPRPSSRGVHSGVVDPESDPSCESIHA